MQGPRSTGHLDTRLHHARRDVLELVVLRRLPGNVLNPATASDANVVPSANIARAGRLLSVLGIVHTRG